MADGLSSPRQIVRAFLLLSVQERPGHGYELVGRMDPAGADANSIQRVYRALRWLAAAGFIEPTWETTGPGPGRRIYGLSPAGEQALDVSAVEIRRHAEMVNDNLSPYVLKRLRLRTRDEPAFEFTVAARLSVEALDEASAGRKLVRMFGTDCALDAHIRSTGEVSIKK